MKHEHTVMAWLLRFLGLTLLGSSLLKGLSPEQAVSWLSSAGLGMRVGFLLVPAIGIVEAMVGATLLVFPGWRWARVSALLFFLTIVLARIGAVLAGVSTDCGCFGAVAVPKTAIWIFLVCGVLVSARSLHQGSSLLPTQGRRLRIAGVAILVALVSAPATLHLLGRQESTTWEEKLTATASEPFLIVGTTDCPHCYDLLEKLPPGKLESIAFLVREDDHGKLRDPSPKLYRIASRTWWNALETAPPALFERRGPKGIRRVGEHEFLERMHR